MKILELKKYIFLRIRINFSSLLTCDVEIQKILINRLLAVRDQLGGGQQLALVLVDGLLCLLASWVQLQLLGVQLMSSWVGLELLGVQLMSRWVQLQLLSIKLKPSWVKLKLLSVQLNPSWVELQLLSIQLMSSRMQLKLLGVQLMSSWVELQLLGVQLFGCSWLVLVGVGAGVLLLADVVHSVQLLEMQ